MDLQERMYSQAMLNTLQETIDMLRMWQSESYG
jgi:hypothetical protein